MRAAVGGLADEGEDVSRILALSDGVFAFAMTLLVINLLVPGTSSLDALAPNLGRNGQLARYLGGEWPAFFTYALAFILIGTWWVGHLRLFRVVRRYDRRFLTLNLLFLMLIAVTAFDVGLLASYGDIVVGVTTYAAAQTAAGALLVLLWLYVWLSHPAWPIRPSPPSGPDGRHSALRQHLCCLQPRLRPPT